MSVMVLNRMSKLRENYDWGGEMVSRVEGREQEVGTAEGGKECEFEWGE